MGEEHIFSTMFSIFELMSQFNIYIYILDHVMITYILTVAVRIMAGLVSISFVYQMYKKVTEGQGSYLKIIIYIVIVSLMIGVYPNFYIEASLYINELSANLLNLSQAKETLSAIGGHPIDDGESGEEKPWYQKAIDLFGIHKVLSSLSLPNVLAQYAMVFSNIATFIVFLIRNISILYLLAIAPFFFSCLLFEPVTPYFFGWLKSFINVLLWPIWLAVIMLIQSIIIANMDVTNSVIIAYGMAAANVVYVFYIIKVMRTLPSMRSGTAGSFNTFEGLATVAAMALMKKSMGGLLGGFKGIGGGGGGSGATSTGSSAGSSGLKAPMTMDEMPTKADIKAAKRYGHGQNYSKLGIKDFGKNPPPKVVKKDNGNSNKSNRSSEAKGDNGANLESKKDSGNSNKSNRSSKTKEDDEDNLESKKEKNKKNERSLYEHEMIPCPKCGGDGVIEEHSHNKEGVCFMCNGTGEILNYEDI